MKSSKLSLNSIPNVENKDSENLAPIPNLLKKDEQNSHENIIITLKSEDEGTSTESEPRSKDIYLVYEEELLSSQSRDNLSEDKENIKNTKQVLGKKRKSHHNLSNPYKEKFSSNSIRKMKSQGNTPTKNMKENKNNDDSEVNFYYNELEKIMENYSFFEVSKLILKAANDITEDNDDNHELYQKLKNISSNIKNKDNLALICLSVLSSKIQFKKGENKIKKQAHSNEGKRATNMNKAAKGNYKQKYIFRDHFYNINNKIFCYKNKSKNPSYKTTLYCEKRNNKGCKALIVINSDFNNVLMYGDHEHEGISKNTFYKRFPTFKDKKWNHIQIIKNERE